MQKYTLPILIGTIIVTLVVIIVVFANILNKPQNIVEDKNEDATMEEIETGKYLYNGITYCNSDSNYIELAIQELGFDPLYAEVYFPEEVQEIDYAPDIALANIDTMICWVQLVDKEGTAYNIVYLRDGTKLKSKVT